MNQSLIGQTTKYLKSSLTVDELIKIASNLVAIPSFTGQETPLAKYINSFCKTHKIPTFLQKVEPGRFQVIAHLGPENKKPALLLNGHLDMDPLGRDWSGNPFKIKVVGDKFYGAGIHNMKSGLTAILGAALALKKSNLLIKKPLLLEFVVGELQGGKGTLFALKSGLTADVAVIPEPYSIKRVLTQTAGVYKFAIVVRGLAAHTSRPEEGVDAIKILRDVLGVVEKTPLKLKNSGFPSLPRLQIASIIAGRGEEHNLSGISYCADKATALIDLRYPPPFEPKDVDAAIKKLIAVAKKVHPTAEITIDHPPDPVFAVGGTDMPPMNESPKSSIVRDISSLLPQVSNFQVEETGIALPYSYAGNDTAHLSRAGIECCLFGPRGATPDHEKHVLISEMVACARTLAALAILRCTY